MRLNLEVLKMVVALSSPFGLSTHPSATSVRCALSATEESGSASISRPRAKREISALSAAIVFSQAQRMTAAKLKSTYSR